MSWREPVAVIMRAYRDGVALNVEAGGKLGWKAAQKPSEALLTALAGHKAAIIALIAPPPPERHAAPRAKRRITQLRALAFWPYLSEEGALLIADEAGQRRGVADYLPVAAVFDDLVAGLAEEPRLLDFIRDPGKGEGNEK